MRTITFMGPLRRPDQATIDHVVHTAESVGDLLTKLGYPETQHRFIRVFSQGIRLGSENPLPSTGEIVLMLPLGGG